MLYRATGYSARQAAHQIPRPRELTFVIMNLTLYPNFIICVIVSELLVHCFFEVAKILLKS